MSRTIRALSEKKLQAWRLYKQKESPADSIQQQIVVVKAEYLAIMTSWCTYILLPQNHILLNGKRHLKANQEFAVGSESIGVVQQIGMMCCLSNARLDWLRSVLSREDYLAVLNADRWLQIDYSNLNEPADQVGLLQDYRLAAKLHVPVKVAMAERKQDLRTVLVAAIAINRKYTVVKA